MPRLAFIFDSSDLGITLVEVSENPRQDETVRLSYAKHATEKGKYVFGGVVANASTERTVVSIARVLSLFGAAIEKYSGNLHDPVDLIQSLKAAGARHCVWNGQKLVTVRKLKEDQSMFFAQHLKEFSTQAPNEKSAKERLTRIITDAMVAKPARAKDLASWFAAGQPVIEEKPGAALNVIRFEEAFPGLVLPKSRSEEAADASGGTETK